MFGGEDAATAPPPLIVAWFSTARTLPGLRFATVIPNPAK